MADRSVGESMHNGCAVHPRVRRVVGALVAMTLVAAAGCGGDDDDDAATATTTAVTDGSGSETTTEASSADDVLGPVDEASGEPVRVGFVYDGQGTAGDNQGDLDTANATVEYLNTHRGGIAGRPIELVVCDTQTDPARGTDCGNQMVEEGVPLVAIGQSGVYESIWQPLHDAGIPTIFFTTTGENMLGDTESTFAFASPGFSNVAFPISVAEDAGVDRVTVITIDVPPAIEPFQGSTPQTYEDAGLDLEVIPVPIGTADMTPQLQSVVAGDPGLVHVVGNDTFCISAFQALEALAYDGPITAISFCISDATRQAFPDGYLEGMNIALTAPIGEDDSTELFRTVVDTFATTEVDTSRVGAVSAFVLFAGIDAALDGLEGDVTPDSVTAAMKSMEETELPGAGGIRFRCDGTAVPEEPAACTGDGLYTVLDASGQPTTVELAAA
jgi:branched-chain amino acid transport system substrate-binding protein